MVPELYIKTNCTIGEGPVWDEDAQTLYFIDILGQKIFSHDGKKLTEMSTGRNIGCAVLREKGGMAAGMIGGWYFVDFPDGEITFIGDPEADNPESRFNDGKADPAGRFWTGTMSTKLDTGYGEAGPDSGLYCLDTDLHMSTLATDIIQGNGMGWTHDAKKFYFIDTQRFHMKEFDCDIEKPELTNCRICIDFKDYSGIPDGMTVDDEGMVWVAFWGGSCIRRFDPRDGKLLETVELPALNVTCCCFGGKNMDELFITTGALGTDLEKYPLAGSVFKLKPGVSGARSFKFKV